MGRHSKNSQILRDTQTDDTNSSDDLIRAVFMFKASLDRRSDGKFCN